MMVTLFQSETTDSACSKFNDGHSRQVSEHTAHIKYFRYVVWTFNYCAFYSKYMYENIGYLMNE